MLGVMIFKVLIVPFMTVQPLGFRILVFLVAFCSCMFAPPPQDEPIADALVQGLDIARRANHAQRTVEPLVSHLHHADPMNETECLGSLKNIVNNSIASLVARDVALLEWMRHISRHISYHIISSYTIPYHTQSYHIISYHIVSYNVI